MQIAMAFGTHPHIRTVPLLQLNTNKVNNKDQKPI